MAGRHIIIGLSFGIALLMSGCGGHDHREDQSEESWSPDPRPLASTLVYECADYEFVARLGPGEMAVWLEDRYLILSQVRSASGVKYQESDTIFWMKGQESTLLLDGQRYTDCRLNPARAPWEDARRRGVSFRATGNEPGWHLEIQSQRQIMFVSAYGMQRVIWADPGSQREGKTRRYSVVENGKALELTIIDHPCTDSMRGDLFPSEVILKLNGSEFLGCGMDLEYPWE